MTKEEFNNISLAEQGLTIITEGKYITQIKQGDYLNNLYTIEDFFIEIIYSISTNEITKIEVLDDLSKIDQYIEGNQRNQKNKVKGAVSLN
ncbi:MAG: hypothetical protein PWP52_940 [Bacteroidales bacterium]|jgi:hypothetical protein|nr:hypothetical protein [Bacteroidales bacterium]